MRPIILCIVLLLSSQSDDALFVNVGLEHDATSIRTGRCSDDLHEAARKQAIYQASHGLGHQHWQNRVKELHKKLPGYTFGEVVAMTTATDKRNAMNSIFDAWRNSSRHWAIVGSPCDFFGYAVARGEDGAMYACGIVAHKDTD